MASDLSTAMVHLLREYVRVWPRLVRDGRAMWDAGGWRRGILVGYFGLMLLVGIAYLA